MIEDEARKIVNQPIIFKMKRTVKHFEITEESKEKLVRQIAALFPTSRHRYGSK